MLNIIQNPSPNYTVNKNFKPVGVVVHGSIGSYKGCVEWLKTPPEKRTPTSWSSAHYVISKLGEVTQLVDTEDVAWHAGTISNPTAYAQSVLPKTILGTFKNPNESFIGIELEWFTGDIVTEAQYLAICEIVKINAIKNPIILTHKEITDYKGDFVGVDGKIDLTISNEIRKRITPVSVAPPQVDREAIKAQIINLIKQL